MRIAIELATGSGVTTATVTYGASSEDAEVFDDVAVRAN